MSEGGAERRESGRAAIELRIEYERLNALLADYTLNISRGGTFIRTERPLGVGTRLSFTIQAPMLEEPIVLRGAVRWVVERDRADADHPAGMGIAFLFDSAEQRAAVEERLDRLMVSALGRATFEKLMGRPAPSEDQAT